MIKIAAIADIHLPYLCGTVQYEALEFAIESIKKNKVDAVVCLGDATANGDSDAAKFFIKRMGELDAVKLFVLGNSDLRTKETAEYINILQTDREIDLCDIRCIGIDTSKGEISLSDTELLKSSDKDTIVFMHHPYWDGMTPESMEIIKSFQVSGNYRALVHGHIHYFERKGNVYSIQALDPDKSIGEPPCVTYFVIEDEEIHTEFDYFPSKMPENMDEFLGLSCFIPEIDIPVAIENGIKNIELRPNAVYDDRKRLLKLIKMWRSNGGKYLSLHMPDFGYDGELIGEKEWMDALECASDLRVDGVTVHVPKVSLKAMKSGAEPILLQFISSNIRKLPAACKVGIENMHMTAAESDNDDRRFGYVPQECIYLMNKTNELFGFERVGLLLDVGHARNNVPFSEKYPVGVWYGEVGKHTIAYHIHQISKVEKGMENHTPITSLYGPLISYCGFSHCWNHGEINQGPLFLEIRGGYEEYIRSVKLFR